jgi:hypothetical protein
MNPLDTADFIRANPSEPAAWLKFWSWLVPTDLQAICATRLGDAFLLDPHGSIWWLDVGGSKLELVGSQSDWESKLRQPKHLDHWSGRVLVEKLKAAGMALAPQQCYTYWTHPIMGGAYDAANFKVVPVQTHFDIWGPLLERVKDLPDGTNVTFKVVP